MAGVEGWFVTGGWFVTYGWIHALGVDGEGLVDGVGGVAIIDGIVFFWCVKQPKVVYFVEFYAFRVLRAFVVFYQ
ncbi:hypothetical protein [Bartonella sp. AA18HLJMS]|uniref:hypothetical protein n=1 Tax=Bartonella sp. AA18HLJMS TaxID=3243430 RepID=UPI0035D01FC5